MRKSVECRYYSMRRVKSNDRVAVVVSLGQQLAISRGRVSIVETFRIVSSGRGAFRATWHCVKKLALAETNAFRCG